MKLLISTVKYSQYNWHMLKRFFFWSLMLPFNVIWCKDTKSSLYSLPTQPRPLTSNNDLTRYRDLLWLWFKYTGIGDPSWHHTPLDVFEPSKQNQIPGSCPRHNVNEKNLKQLKDYLFLKKTCCTKV
jgi:hypothetical protein